MSFRVRSKDPQVRAIIKGIQRDLTGRAGCRWDNIDDDIQQEIVNAWVTIAERVLQTSVSHSNRGGASSPTSTIDAAIDVFAQAPNAPGARTQLRAAIDSYARGKLGDLTDVVHEAATALAGRRLTGTSTLPAFVKMLQEQGRTDAQLERMLLDVFEGLVTHLHTRGDPATSIHSKLVGCARTQADEMARAVEAAEDAAFLRGRDAVRKFPDGWGLIARPTPDEARRLVSAAIGAGIGLACHGSWSDEQRRSADAQAEAARTALLRALGVEP